MILPMHVRCTKDTQVHGLASARGWQHQAKTAADLRLGFPAAMLMNPQLFLQNELAAREGRMEILGEDDLDVQGSATLHYLEGQGTSGRVARCWCAHTCTQPLFATNHGILHK